LRSVMRDRDSVGWGVAMSPSRRFSIACLGLVCALPLALGACATVPPSERREVSGSDPIAAVFSECSDLFSQKPVPRTCEVVEDRGNAGADIVRERITCRQRSDFVNCKGRPGEGPGPEEYRLDFSCSRTTRKCEIVSGSPQYVEAYAPLFESHNRAVAESPAHADSR
jgi:hypothetical protein